MIHYSWILPTKRCTIQNYNKVEEEEKSGISPFWALPRYRFSANLDSRILVRGSKDKGVANRGHSFRELHSKESRF